MLTLTINGVQVEAISGSTSEAPRTRPILPHI